MKRLHPVATVVAILAIIGALTTYSAGQQSAPGPQIEAAAAPVANTDYATARVFIKELAKAQKNPKKYENVIVRTVTNSIHIFESVSKVNEETGAFTLLSQDGQDKTFTSTVERIIFVELVHKPKP